MSLTFSPIDNQVTIPITRINSNTLATRASFSAITTTAIFSNRYGKYKSCSRARS